MGQMDAERVATVLARVSSRARVGHTSVEGDQSVLNCAECGSDVHLRPAQSGLPPAMLPMSRGDFYICGTCRKVSAPAHEVNRELQALVEDAWSDDAWRRNWFAPAVQEVEAEIAEAHAVYAWCADAKHARRALRKGSDRHVDLRWSLYQLGTNTVTLVKRRAALAELSGRAPRADAPRLARLVEAEFAYASVFLHGGDRVDWFFRAPSGREMTRALAREHGGRRKLNAHAAELRDLLWTLLAEPEWRDADTSVLWEVTALAEDWGTTSISQMKRWTALVTAAAGDRRLVLAPENPGGSRVHMSSSESPG
ncbi:hypothetical protein [Prauserella cavernicola]|uniref:Uncharacterized protein n=1 Tax=Prauserella cavernicola TaxID=2800127 RepID=A0A934QXQ9_9PSEU|nr:hypothetical protein [Prauserella cavernicola]MBK1787444.1 hypothetical protein [Prauserella cavernicola]